MARLTLMRVVSTIALCAAGAAQAADLLPPAPSLEGSEIVELGTGWYLRGDIGYVDYVTPRDVGFGLPTVAPLDGERIDKTVSLGGGIGYQFTNWLRADATVDYRFGAEFSGTRPNPTYALGYVRDRADFESGTILFNAYADLGSWYGITPYVGAGIGVSGNRFTNISREAFVLGAPVGAAVLSPRTTYNLAWALMAGVAIDTGVGFLVDLGYRYIRLGDVRTRIDAPGPGIKTDEIDAHEIRVGARYMID